MAAELSYLDLYDSCENVNKIIKIQAFVRGKMVRAQMKQIRQLFEMIVLQLEGQDTQVVWQDNMFSYPVLRKYEKAASPSLKSYQSSCLSSQDTASHLISERKKVPASTVTDFISTKTQTDHISTPSTMEHHSPSLNIISGHKSAHDVQFCRAAENKQEAVRQPLNSGRSALDLETFSASTHESGSLQTEAGTRKDPTSNQLAVGLFQSGRTLSSGIQAVETLLPSEANRPSTHDAISVSNKAGPEVSASNEAVLVASASNETVPVISASCEALIRPGTAHPHSSSNNRVSGLSPLHSILSSESNICECEKLTSENDKLTSKHDKLTSEHGTLTSEHDDFLIPEKLVKEQVENTHQLQPNKDTEFHSEAPEKDEERMVGLEQTKQENSPVDKNGLLQRKKTIWMELLWVQQAINSRKQYLRLKHDLG